MPNFEEDRLAAAEWAYSLWKQKFLILDTETTGLGSDAEICEIAITDQRGRLLFSSLVKPSVGIPDQAISIHGISNQMVQSAPRFAEIFPVLVGLLKGQTVLIYNAAYDLRILRYCCVAAQRPWIDVEAFMKSFIPQCAMLPYSAYCGEWNDYHGNYKWQKLPGGDHSAAGDCKATAQIVRQMALTWKQHLERNAG